MKWRLSYQINVDGTHITVSEMAEPFNQLIVTADKCPLFSYLAYA